MQHSSVLLNSSPQEAKQLLVCIDREEGSLEFYDSQGKCWQPSHLSLSLPHEQKMFQLELLGSTLYALGGFDERYKATNKVWRFDLSESSYKWTARAPMSECRCDFAVVSLRSHIYVLGGSNKNPHAPMKPIMSSCERYDSQRNAWSTVAHLSIARDDASAAPHSGLIYIAGGRNEKHQVERSVERYDPASDTWTQVAPMSTPRRDFSLTPFAGRLWAIGGYDGNKVLSTVESYDPLTDTWREEAQLRGRPIRHSAVDFHGQLYVVGGISNETAEKYVPGEGWKEIGKPQNIKDISKLLIFRETYSKLITTDYFKQKKLEYVKKEKKSFQIEQSKLRAESPDLSLPILPACADIGSQTEKNIISCDEQSEKMTSDGSNTHLDYSSLSCETQPLLQKKKHHFVDNNAPIKLYDPQRTTNNLKKQKKIGLKNKSEKTNKNVEPTRENVIINITNNINLKNSKIDNSILNQNSNTTSRDNILQNGINENIFKNDTSNQNLQDAPEEAYETPTDTFITDQNNATNGNTHLQYLSFFGIALCVIGTSFCFIIIIVYLALTIHGSSRQSSNT